MSRKRFAFAVVLALAILALGVLALPTAAGAAAPVCPDGFMAVAAGEHHHEGDHDHEHHRHVGLWPNADLNGDGTVCVKHLNQGGQHIHVFVDNVTE
jgi:hypothetical protein